MPRYLIELFKGRFNFRYELEVQTLNRELVQMSFVFRPPASNEDIAMLENQFFKVL